MVAISREGPDLMNEPFPAGLKNAFIFSTLNALSFQIILSSPMVLYAKKLGASATILGLIAGMMPLLVIFQIPAANYIPRLGYKRFVYGGWGLRVMFIFVMALVPLAWKVLNPVSQLGLLIFLLFAFNLSRGISSCAWLPWITSLVPLTVRGRYLTIDAAVVNVGSFFAFVVAAFSLGNAPQQWQFSVIFAFSALMGAASLTFLKRIPDAPIPEQQKTSNTPIPWLGISRFGPFRKLLWMNVAWAIGYGGLSAFTTAFLRVEVGLPAQRVLLISSAVFVGGLGSLWLSSRLDRLGSKPILTLSLWMWLAVMLGWVLVSAKWASFDLWLILALQFGVGLAGSLVNTANVRLAMVIVPEMGRNHFFALFSVVLNLTLGLAPVIWGVLIDVWGPVRYQLVGLEWNRFSLFYAGSGLAFLVTLILCRRLEESNATTMPLLLHEILIKTPHRAWTRIWQRD
jgi:MFS family permease